MLLNGEFIIPGFYMEEQADQGAEEQYEGEQGHLDLDTVDSNIVTITNGDHLPPIPNNRNQRYGRQRPVRD